MQKPQSATAIKSVMTQGFASFLVRIGEKYAAATLIVQQSGLLRPCEVLNLTREYVRLPGSIVLKVSGQRVVKLVIRNAKTEKNGKSQVALIEDEVAVKTLELLMDSNKNIPKTANLFANITYTHYAKQLQLAAKFFDLDHVKVTPLGARLGKAVGSFNRGIPLSDIAVGGRWSSLESAISYIKNGQASLINVNISLFTESEIRKEVKAFKDMIRDNWGALYERGEVIEINN